MRRRRPTTTARLKLGEDEPTPIVDVGLRPSGASSAAVLRSLLERALAALEAVGTPAADAIARDIRSRLAKVNPAGFAPYSVDKDLSKGFEDGNYSESYYEDESLDEVLRRLSANKSPAYVAAFILGFFSSYSLHEIPDRDLYDDAYYSKYGQKVVKAGYIDSRDDEYERER